MDFSFLTSPEGEKEKKMRSIGRTHTVSFKIFALAVALSCSYLYISDKITLYSMPQDYVIRRCSGAHTMSSVCECYNYHGRHCLSEKRLVWDVLPDEEEGASSAAGDSEETGTI